MSTKTSSTRSCAVALGSSNVQPTVPGGRRRRSSPTAPRSGPQRSAEPRPAHGDDPHPADSGSSGIAGWPQPTDVPSRSTTHPWSAPGGPGRPSRGRGASRSSSPGPPRAPASSPSCLLLPLGVPLAHRRVLGAEPRGQVSTTGHGAKCVPSKNRPTYRAVHIWSRTRAGDAPSAAGRAGAGPHRPERRTTSARASSAPRRTSRTRQPAHRSAPAAAVSAWLERTLRVVPPGSEQDHLGLDKGLSALLTMTPRDDRWPSDQSPEAGG